MCGDSGHWLYPALVPTSKGKSQVRVSPRFSSSSNYHITVQLIIRYTDYNTLLLICDLLLGVYRKQAQLVKYCFGGCAKRRYRYAVLFIGEFVRAVCSDVAERPTTCPPTKSACSAALTWLPALWCVTDVSTCAGGHTHRTCLASWGAYARAAWPSCSSAGQHSSTAARMSGNHPHPGPGPGLIGRSTGGHS